MFIIRLSCAIFARNFVPIGIDLETLSTIYSHIDDPVCCELGFFSPPAVSVR